VAIANTLFWKNISILCCYRSPPSGQFHIAREFLARSRGAALSVKIETLGCESNIINVWMLDLSKEFHRLEEFDADVGQGSIAYEKLDFPAPNLKSLSLRWWNPVSSAFPSMFNNQFPSLRKLDLSNFTTWPSGLFMNLTSLALRHREKEVSGMEFLDVLQVNPTLTELTIDQHGPFGEDVCHGRVIHLPSLQILLLKGCNLEFILTHVRFPQSCRVELYDSLYYMRSILGLDPGTADIFTGMPRKFIHEYIPNFIEKLVVVYENYEFQVHAQQLHFSLTIKQPFDQFDDADTFMFTQRSLYAISNCQPLTSAQKLSIYGSRWDGVGHLFSEQLWDPWFSQLDRLERLELRCMEMNKICTALLKENTLDNLYCSKLRSLEIETHDASTDNLRLVSDLVKGRFTRGLPLKDIRVNVLVYESLPEREFLKDLWERFVEEVRIEVHRISNTSEYEDCCLFNKWPTPVLELEDTNSDDTGDWQSESSELE
jgi:hypothetical protein